MPDKLTLPDKGQRIRVTGVNGLCQRMPDLEGVVEGIEFRCDPPIVSVIADGRRHDIQNFGNGMTWEPV